MKNLHTVALAAVVAATTAAHADIVSVGNAPVAIAGHLSRAAGSDIIQDSLNDRQWLGADVTRGLSFAQTMAAVAVGGRFAGYTVARDADAMKFQAALFDSTQACTDQAGLATCSGAADNQRAQVFGESYADSGANGGDVDYAWFLARKSDGGPAVGYLELVSDATSSTLSVNHAWGSLRDADSYSGNTPYAIGWLLFRDGLDASVPEPGALALAALALAGVVTVRRRAGPVAGSS